MRFHELKPGDWFFYVGETMVHRYVERGGVALVYTPTNASVVVPTALVPVCPASGPDQSPEDALAAFKQKQADERNAPLIRAIRRYGQRCYEHGLERGGVSINDAAEMAHKRAEAALDDAIRLVKEADHA